MPAQSDEELVAQYRLAPASPRGRQLVDELFERHRARVVAWCYRFVGDPTAAPDLAQDVFVKAYTGLDAFRTDAKFTTWLYVITRNRCMDEVRSRASQPRAVSEEALLEAEAPDWNAALAALDARDARTMVNALMREELTETEQRVMTMHYGHEMRLDAITAALGLTNTSGAKAFIVSAKRKLNVAVRRWKSRN